MLSNYRLISSKYFIDSRNLNNPFSRTRKSWCICYTSMDMFNVIWVATMFWYFRAGNNKVNDRYTIIFDSIKIIYIVYFIKTCYDTLVKICNCYLKMNYTKRSKQTGDSWND